MASVYCTHTSHTQLCPIVLSICMRFCYLQCRCLMLLIARALSSAFFPPTMSPKRQRSRANPAVGFREYVEITKRWLTKAVHEVMLKMPLHKDSASLMPTKQFDVRIMQFVRLLVFWCTTSRACAGGAAGDPELDCVHEQVVGVFDFGRCGERGHTCALFFYAGSQQRRGRTKLCSH